MSRRRNLHPTEGVRFILERTEDQGPRATYRASVYTPDAVFTGTATLAEDGTADLVATGAGLTLHRNAGGVFTREGRVVRPNSPGRASSSEASWVMSTWRRRPRSPPTRSDSRSTSCW